jgi:hypothetical protein
MLKLITILSLAILFGCKHPTDCSKFKNGTFTYQSSNTDRMIVIERDDTIQFERNLVTGSVAKCRIKWVSPCEYELILLSASGFSPKGQLFLTTNTNHVTITEVGNDYYKAHSVIKGDDKTVEHDYLVKVVK